MKKYYWNGYNRLIGTISSHVGWRHSLIYADYRWCFLISGHWIFKEESGGGNIRYAKDIYDRDRVTYWEEVNKS